MSKTINLLSAAVLLAASLAACTTAAVTPLSDTSTLTAAVAVTNSPQANSPRATLARTMASPATSPTPADTATTPTPVPRSTYDCPFDSTVDTKGAGGSGDPIRVAFISQDGIQLWDEESDTVETLFEADNVTRLKFSGDGQRIVFERQLENYHKSLWVVGADGQDARERLSPEALLAMNLSDTKDHMVYPHHVVWVPGSHKLAFSTLSIPQADGMPDVFKELRVIDADTGAHEILLGVDNGGRFTYSPDGVYIALVSSASVSLLRADGTKIARDIVTYPALGITDDYHYPTIKWDADSRVFTFAVINAVDNMDVFYNPDVTSTIWRVTIDGSATELATITGMATGPAFSPDLNQVAFMRVSPQGPPLRGMHIADVYGAWDIVYGEGERVTFWQWQPEDEAGEFIFLEQGKPFLGRLCRHAIPLQPQAGPDELARRLKWVDEQRFLYMQDDRTLHLGTLDGSHRLVGESLADVRPGIRTLAVYDFHYASAPASLPATATSRPSPTPWMKNGCYFLPYGIGGDVPVFAAPDINSPVLGTIAMGEKYLVIHRAGEWRVEEAGTSGSFYKIQLDELTAGWVLDMRGGLEGACTPYQTRTDYSATLARNAASPRTVQTVAAQTQASAIRDAATGKPNGS